MRKLTAWSFPVILLLGILGCGSFEPMIIEKHRETRSSDIVSKGIRLDLEKTARTLLGAPYRYGGTDRSGFDCSGFTVFTFRENGIALPRTAANQYREGRTVSVPDARKGDLAFFQLNGQIDHVGLVTKANKKELWIIHSTSSRGVMHQNVLSSSYWKPRLKGVKDILGE